MSKIALILTSTRKGRVGGHVATWVSEVLETVKSSDADITLVDVADFNLPVFDEAVIPAMVPKHADWTTPHARAWSDEIQKYDGYSILANEYNFGLSGSTKNAVDYLYHAWIGKPILVVTYGIMGGTFSSDQLSNTLKMMHLKVVETRPQLPFAGEPTGPDVQAAMGGTLSEDTKNLWDAEKKEVVLKGFEELKTLLREKDADKQGVADAKAE